MARSVPHRRQSWEDLVENVDRRSDHSSDLIPSIPGSGSVTMPHAHTKRESWSNMVESVENLNSKVTDDPSLPIRSDESTLESNPEVTILTSKKMGGFPNNIGYASNRNPKRSSKGDNCCCPCTKRRILIWSVIAVGLILLVSVLGVVIDKAVNAAATTVLTLQQGNLPSGQMEVKIYRRMATFSVADVTDIDYVLTKAYFKADPMIMIYQDQFRAFGYCFVATLNQTAFPNIDYLKHVVQNSENIVHDIQYLPERWVFQVQQVERHIAERFGSIDSSCSRKNILWMTMVPHSTQFSQCPGCKKLCVPGLSTHQRQDEYHQMPLMTLALTSKDCFWFYAPDQDRIGSADAGRWD